MGGAGPAAAALGLAVIAAAARGAVLLLAAWLAVRLLRRRAAALRHAVWAAALGAHLVLPVLSLALPRWTLIPPPGTPWVLRAVLSGVTPVHTRGEARSAASHRTRSGADADPTLGGWAAVCGAVWVAGAGVLLLRRAAAARALGRLAREAHPLTDVRWRDLAGAAAADVGLDRPVTLLRGAALAVPVTWGVRRPVVLLPQDAGAWDDARRRLVLLHELAHAARGDVLVLRLAQCAVVAFWFDPLVWLAARRLAAEAERAADDEVLRAGTAPSAYVAALVEIVRTRQAPPPFVPALVAGRTLGRQSTFETRMRGVLDAAADRRALSGRAAALLAFGVLACAATLAAIRPPGPRVAPMQAAPVRASPGRTAGAAVPAMVPSAPRRTPAARVRPTKMPASIPASRGLGPGRAWAVAPPAPTASEPTPAAERLRAGDPAPSPTTRPEILAPPGVERAATDAPGAVSRPKPVAVPVEVPVEVPMVVPPAARRGVPPLRLDVHVDVGVPSVPPLR